MTDLIDGHLSLMFVNTFAGIPQIRSGKLRALGVTGADRLDVLPNVPTLAQAGIPGFDLRFWSAVLAPRGTPPEVIRRLNEELVAVVGADAFVSALKDLGSAAIPGPPEALTRRLKADCELTRRLATEHALKLEP